MRFVVLIFCLIASRSAAAQATDSTSEAYLSRIVGYLASDELRGRGNYSGGLHQAAVYIAREMLAAGLKPFPGDSDYFIPYETIVEKGAGSKAGDKKGLLTNVIGIIEGRSKPGEAIIFSAHYDHVGVDGQIFNGANDNASGVAVMLAIMHHYSITKSNERTLIFCAFSGEEIGLLGSTAFRELVEPSSIKAVLNLEMLGKFNIRGRKMLMITGTEHSNLRKIMNASLKGSPYSVLFDPNPEKQLHARSDHFPFHNIDLVAHTLMSSNDDEPCYHRPCDDASKLDYTNMVHLVKAIILGSSTLVDGSVTPQRR